MKTALIIPIYKQTKYWIRLMSGIEKQTVPPDYVYVMMDRPTEEEYNYVKNACASKNLKTTYKVFNLQEIPEFIGRPNNVPDFELFLAGHNRNVAIDTAIEDDCKIFVMTDGDCIPEINLIKTHYEINSMGIPSITCGRRKDAAHKWRDQRDVDPKLKALDLFKHGNGFIIQNQELLHMSSIIWTCNVGINIEAVKLIKKLNEKYYGRSEVFCSEFSGTWGGEDSFLGIQANMCRIFISIINEEKSGIRHINHPRPQRRYNEQNFSIYLKNHVKVLNEMQLNNPLKMEFFNKI